jgi:hypothetical protein
MWMTSGLPMRDNRRHQVHECNTAIDDKVGHIASPSPTTAIQFPPPSTNSCANVVNGNHPGALV